MLANANMMAPVVALIAWSMVMWIWMYATRLPAIRRSRMKLDPNAASGEQMASLPAPVRWKADNYNHLMEQPTVFYALAIAIALIGEGGSVNANLAWAYVACRIVHSLVQALSNKIEVRFLFFVLSNIPLFVLTFNAAMGLMNK